MSETENKIENTEQTEAPVENTEDSGDRKSVVQGKSVDIGGRRSIKKKKKKNNNKNKKKKKQQKLSLMYVHRDTPYHVV